MLHCIVILMDDIQIVIHNVQLWLESDTYKCNLNFFSYIGK